MLLSIRGVFSVIALKLCNRGDNVSNNYSMDLDPKFLHNYIVRVGSKLENVSFGKSYWCSSEGKIQDNRGKIRKVYGMTVWRRATNDEIHRNHPLAPIRDRKSSQEPPRTLEITTIAGVKYVMSDKAIGNTYDQFIATGWTNKQLIHHGFLNAMVVGVDLAKGEDFSAIERRVSHSFSPSAIDAIKPCTVNQIIKRKTKMLTIRTVTLINDKESSEFEVEELLHMIDVEQERLEKLSALKFESKAVTKLKERHESNVKSLIVILDKKEVFR